MDDVWLQLLEVGSSSLVFLHGDINIPKDEGGPFKKLHWFWYDLPSAFCSKYYAENVTSLCPPPFPLLLEQTLNPWLPWSSTLICVLENTVVLEPAFASHHRLYKNWKCLGCITQKFWFSRSKMRPEVLFFFPKPQSLFSCTSWLKQYFNLICCLNNGRRIHVGRLSPW